MSPEQTVRELVVNYPALRPQLEKLGIDYCCGGVRSVKRCNLPVWNEARQKTL
ncbi:DUF542 domain-containing protein [Psychromonas sp.]|uniref:DUF542 domain-containing protein n=1 Tax=Psychromonas sp. TaxID=1884585 RepID=UPI0039E6A947